MMFINQDDPEWDRMWAALESSEGSRADTNDGESWMYMGTIVRDFVLTHQFRHRAHPTRGRTVVDLPASYEFSEVQR